MFPLIGKSSTILGGVLAPIFVRPNVGCGTMFRAIRLRLKDRLTAKVKISFFWVSDRPATGLGRQGRQGVNFRFFLFWLSFLSGSSDRRRATFKPKPMRFTDHRILGHAKAFADLSGRQTFGPQLFELSDAIICPYIRHRSPQNLAAELYEKGGNAGKYTHTRPTCPQQEGVGAQ